MQINNSKTLVAVLMVFGMSAFQPTAFSSPDDNYNLKSDAKASQNADQVCDPVSGKPIDTNDVEALQNALRGNGLKIGLGAGVVVGGAVSIAAIVARMNKAIGGFKGFGAEDSCADTLRVLAASGEKQESMLASYILKEKLGTAIEAIISGAKSPKEAEELIGKFNLLLEEIEKAAPGSEGYAKAQKKLAELTAALDNCVKTGGRG